MERDGRADERRARLLAARSDAVDRLAHLERDHAEIVEIVQLDVPDDEHDPDGSTLAWERQQLAALIADQRTTVAALDEGLTRLAAGDYGRCEGCGEPIPSARLAIRPQARRCVPCASGERRPGT